MLTWVFENHRDTQTFEGHLVCAVEMFANLSSQLRDCIGFRETILVILF